MGLAGLVTTRSGPGPSAAGPQTDLRECPQVTVVFRSGREWLAVAGNAQLAGPLDPLEALPMDHVPGLPFRLGEGGPVARGPTCIGRRRPLPAGERAGDQDGRPASG